MRTLRIFFVLGSVLMLSTARAYAFQIDLSGDNIDRYFQILENYVLPLMVVSTIVLFCGYLASRIFHRTVSRREDGARVRDEHVGSGDDGTEAFLRELKASPPIDDGDSDVRREPTVTHNVRPPHPLLRRRATARAQGDKQEQTEETRPVRPLTATRNDADVDTGAAADGAPVFPAAPSLKAPDVTAEREDAPAPADKPKDAANEAEDEPRETEKSPPRRVPLLKAAFRRTRQKAADAEPPVEPTPDLPTPDMPATDETAPIETTPVEPKPGEPKHVESAPFMRRPETPAPLTAQPERASPVRDENTGKNKLFGLAARARAAREMVEDDTPPFPLETQRATEPAGERQEPEPQPQPPEERKLPQQASRDVPEAPDEHRREEPTISVVQSLKTAPASPPAAAVKARAGEVVDSLDYIASVLQQGSVLLAERLKKKQGLTLEDVRGLRASGYDEPDHVLEDLRKLGGDAAEEVLNAFAAVKALNSIVRRLEQMAETEPLDEGWNELIRSRISETIFAVGQVRKTLGIYRRAAKRPAQPDTAQEKDGDVPESGSSVPVGRRQV